MGIPTVIKRGLIMNTENKKELNEEELRAICKCSACGKGVMHTGMPTFYHIKVERYFIKKSAVDRAAGMEQFMGGNVALARVFSTGEPMAVRVGDETPLSFCEDCMQNDHIKIMCMCEKE